MASNSLTLVRSETSLPDVPTIKEDDTFADLSKKLAL